MNLEEHLLSCTTQKAWKKIGISTHHGIAISLASIHSKNSCGIGEFGDLVPLIQWCKEVGFDVIQLLPINDTAMDPSPYNAISSCALNPIYLSLSLLPNVLEDETLCEEISNLNELNQLQQVPYALIYKKKMSFLRKYYQGFGPSIIHSHDFKAFQSQNAWLSSYSLYKHLKETFDQRDHFSWPKEFKNLSKKQIHTLVSAHQREVQFFSVVQFLCFEQLCSVKREAARKKIWIKGDIPILISPDSVEVWETPDLFILDYRAGAPPDFYNPDGQYWGFPLYNWHVMKHYHFAFWKQRLSYAANFYDLYRLDHVIGFFRIWAVLKDGDPKDGIFVPQDESLWEEQGNFLLTTLCSFSDMLPIAEDLGTVPKVVRPVLEKLGICSTKVMRWERFWDDSLDYIPINAYPSVSMTCLSTHDSPTLAQWWRDFPDEVAYLCQEKNWSYSPILDFEKRNILLKDSLHTTSLFHISLLQEFLSLCPDLSWEDIDQERINVPGTILLTNWSFKIKPSIEELKYNLKIKELIKDIIR
ncbi:MAG: 4-alpha-glucanotransferase [Chlamydiae bacterium]|nr:4-alpha-glucanotransferase [Chlamydiota bacterium]